MKFWLDDKRTPPDDTWVWFDTAESITAALEKLHQKVHIISLDHDLGDKLLFGDGYEVMKWIEEKVFTDKTFCCPFIMLHTDNPEGRRMMMLAIAAIQKELKRCVLRL